MATTSDVLKDWVAKHGNAQGEPSVVNPTIKRKEPIIVGGRDTGETRDVEVPNPDPVYRYTFSDGAVLEITGQSGQISKSDEPKAPSSTTTRPPEPNVSTTAAKIPKWNDATKQWDWVDNPNYTAGSSSTTRPPEPAVSTSAPSIPKWDDATKSWIWIQNPNYVPPKPDKNVIHPIGNQLVDDNGKVVYTAPQDWKFETAQDGTILAIDPANPTNKQVIWSPQKPADLVPGQSTSQPTLLQRDPKTGVLTAVPNPIYGQGPPTEVTGQQGPTILQRRPDGSYQTVPNPAYQSKFSQSLSDMQGGIDQIQGMLTRGEITVDQANTYKGALQQNFNAALQGTTPYQQWQDQQARQQQRMQSAQSLLNQRVASGSGLAESLLSSAVGIVGNKNFMDPSAVAGFSPFAGARDYVTELGGGQGVYDAASQAAQAGLKGDDPAAALLQAAFSPPGGPGPGGPAPDQAAAALAPGFGGGPYQGAPNPNVFGSAPTPMPGATDPGLALLNAALGGQYRQPQQFNPLAQQRGPIMG